MASTLGCLDLFCGCGGASIGYAAAGIKTVAAIDSSDAAVAAFEAFIPGVARVVDILETTTSDVTWLPTEWLSPAKLSLVHASPPCTDFSSAGPRIEGPSAELSVIATTVICMLAPHVFVLENVPRFLASTAYARCREIAEAAGYDSVAFELDASLYGVPQTRRRIFWVGARSGSGPLLEAVARDVHAAASLRPKTVDMVLPNAPEFFFLPPRGALNRAIHSSALPAPTLRTNCANAMPAGYARRMVDAAEPRAATLLSLEQLAMMQALPAAPIATSRTVAARLIGNALPPPLATVIGNALRTHGLLDGINLGGTTTRRGSPVRFVPTGRAVTGDARGVLSRRGSTRRNHIALFQHARFTEPATTINQEEEEEEEEEEETDEEGAEDKTTTVAAAVNDTSACAALVLGRRRGVPLLVVTSGMCAICDSVATLISGVPLPAGWKLQVAQRTHTAFRQDDLYWMPPRSATAPRRMGRPIRSLKALHEELVTK